MIPRSTLVIEVAVAAALVTLASLFGRLGRGLWPFDLLANFRLQYTILLVIALVAALALRAWRLGGVLAVVVAIHLIGLAPLVIGSDQPEGPGPALRVIQYNVLTSNDRIDEAATWLVEQDADVIVTQETDRFWADGLQARLDGWRVLRTATIRPDNFGMAVFVRDDVVVGDVEVADPAIPAISVEVETGSGPPLLIYAVHTLPPTSPDQVEVADEQLELAARTLADHDGPELIIGDLNATRWSGSYRSVVDRTGLRNAADGFGLGGTWPTSLWFTGGIGIDHVLVSDDIRVEDWRTGPGSGSDHHPVVVDLVLTAVG